jgi:ARP2/3 complex 16 kDa subunit (p16-Arc)
LILASKVCRKRKLLLKVRFIRVFTFCNLRRGPKQKVVRWHSHTMADDEGAADTRAEDEARLRALEDLEDREKRVDAALRAGKPGDALKIALEKAGDLFMSKDQGLKDRGSAVAAKAIIALGTKDAELTALISGLTQDEADAMMKFLYKALAKPESSGTLLKVHALLVEKAGIGSIVRAIVDRKGPLS